MNTKIHWNENFLNKNSSPCHSRVLLLNWFSVSVLHSGLCLVHRSKKETRNKVQWCNGITNANKQSLVTRRDVIVFTSVWSPLGNIFKSCSRLQAKHAALYLKVKITWNEKRVTGDGNTEPLVKYAVGRQETRTYVFFITKPSVRYRSPNHILTNKVYISLCLIQNRSLSSKC